MDRCVLDFDRRIVLNAERAKRWAADRLPKLSQLGDAFIRRIADNERRIDRANRNAGDPVRQDVRFGEGLINARLKGAKGSTALQHQGDAFERCSLCNATHFKVVPLVSAPSDTGRAAAT